MEMRPIGTVRTAWHEQRGTPIQAAFAPEDDSARVEIAADVAAALADLDGFERIWLITAFDRAGPWQPRVVPYRDTVERGLFSTRAPSRPNPIGLTCVRVLSVDPAAGVIRIGPVDLLDGTPVLDVKPYIPAVDAFPEARAGWFGRSAEGRDRADDRFQAGS